MKVQLATLALLAALAAGTGCKQQPDEKAQADAPDPLAAFLEQVEPVVVVKMHLYPMASVADAADYPYQGQPLGEAHAALLDEALQRQLEEGGLWACYKVQDDLLIFRTGGDEGHSKLVLARADTASGKIEQIDVVAWYSCDARGCDHQEAWLADLDLDNHLELVLRHQKKDAQGRLEADEFTVLTQKGDGRFRPGLEHLLVKENYKMSM